MCLKISQGNSGKLIFPDSQELRGYQYLLNEWTPQRIIQYYRPATWNPNELINGAREPIYNLNHIIRLQAVLEIIINQTAKAFDVKCNLSTQDGSGLPASQRKRCLW